MFDRFSICLAWYWYATHYHGGQFSREYRIFGRLNRIGFEPGAGAKFETLEESDPIAFELYQNLVQKHQQSN